MSKKYSASTTISWGRIHQCYNCHSEFGYRVSRLISAEGPSEEAASIALAKAADSLLVRKNEICDQVACPVCGFYQPEMFLEKFRDFRFVSYIGAVVALVFLIIAFTDSSPSGAYVMTYLCRRWACLLFLAPLMIYCGGIMGCSNRNPQKNLEKTQAKEDILVLTAGTPPLPGEEKQLSRRYVHVFFMTLLLVIFAFLLPTLHEATLSGSRNNPDCAPKYFGPGDRVRVYFSSHITSIKGYWSTHRVSATLTEEGKDAFVTTYPHYANWGNRISGKRRELRESSNQLYTDFTLPMEEERAGKDVNVRFSMSLEYPVSSGANSFDNRTEERNFENSFKLSASGTGTQIVKTEIYSYVAAMILFLVHLFLPMITIRRLRSDIAIPNDYQDVS